MRRGRVGATEIARTVNARPSKLRGLTSRDLTTWHQVKQRCSIFMLHGISGLNELHLSVKCTSLLRHLCVLLYTVLVFFRRQQRQTHQTLTDVLDVLITSVCLFQADFGRLVRLIITCA